MVAFEFLTKGIRIRGHWYPILKMQWIEGVPLEQYIAKHRYDPIKLQELARDWLEMAATLQRLGIAHGDLQHANVLVTPKGIRLIDYDCMFVPALRGRASKELGHRNYQHPLRTSTEFSQTLDNFSIWVIYVTLILVGLNPELWKRFDGGDDCLLFRQRDFQYPDESEVFNALERQNDEALRAVGSLFKSLLYLRPEEIPFIGLHELPNLDYAVIDCQGCGKRLRVPTNKGKGKAACPVCRWERLWDPKELKNPIPVWLKDHVAIAAKKQQFSSSSPSTDIPSMLGATWVVSFLDANSGATAEPTFESSPTLERLLAVVSIITLATVSVASPIYSVTTLSLFTGILSANLALWFYGYRHELAVGESHKIRCKLRGIKKEIRAIEKQLKGLNKNKMRVLGRADVSRQKIAGELATIERRQKRETDERLNLLKGLQTKLRTRQESVQLKETKDLSRIQLDLGARVTNLNRRIVDSKQKQAEEIQQVLRSQQERFVSDFLKKSKVRDAQLSGLGESMKLRLAASGFLTAEDIDYFRVQRVSGIGHMRASVLDSWRQSILKRAKANMPQALSNVEHNNIVSRYTNERANWEAERDNLLQQQTRQIQEVRQRFQPEYKQLTAEQSAAAIDAENDIKSIRHKYTAPVEAIDRQRTELEKSLASDLLVIDDQIAATRRRLFAPQFQLAQTRSSLKKYDRIKLQNYVKRVLFDRNAT